MTDKHYYDKEVTRDEAKENFSVFKKKAKKWKNLTPKPYSKVKMVSTEKQKNPWQRGFQGFFAMWIRRDSNSRPNKE